MHFLWCPVNYSLAKNIYVSFSFLPLYRQLDDLDSLMYQVQVQ